MPCNINWQLAMPINAVIFDCDGTLSKIEGIDELARQNHAGAQVAELTELAMGKTGINPEIYRERLRLVDPTREQVEHLGDLYFQHMTPDADQVIQLLSRLHKTIYIISAGLKPAVSLFGQLLQVPEKNIFAVDIEFNSDGTYIDFDHTSPLTTSHGKRLIDTRLMEEHQTIAHIGDGLNDLVVRDLVTRFIGFGGMFYRASIEAQCDFYIKAPSLAAALPLLLTTTEANALNDADRGLYNKGLDALDAGI
jgi:phosphoserine phosphatase